MGIQVRAGYAEGVPVEFPLAKAPHLLVAGASGSGKSSWLNWVLCEMIYARGPDELRLVMIDPKRVELAPYKGIAHLVFDPVYETTDALRALTWVSQEMEARFQDMERLGVRDLESWNSGHSGTEKRSQVVVVIDELANLILAEKNAEKKIVRLAAMGRAAGIHLLLATQRPSSDVLTGLIRANIPTRVCMPVGTQMESRIVLDQTGGEELAVGEALVKAPGRTEVTRVTFPHINDAQINAVTKTWLK